MLVQLVRGVVQTRTLAEMVSLLPLLHVDGDLKFQDAVTGLLVTQTHILIRFDKYFECPTKLWQLCRTCNAVGCGGASKAVLGTPDDLLDFWYTFPLKQRAWTFDSESATISYVMTKPMQDELEGVFANALAHSLDVDCRHKTRKVKVLRPCQLHAHLETVYITTLSFAAQR